MTEFINIKICDYSGTNIRTKEYWFPCINARKIPYSNDSSAEIRDMIVFLASKKKPTYYTIYTGYREIEDDIADLVLSQLEIDAIGVYEMKYHTLTIVF